MDLELRGKVALITGSSRGVGRATAVLFAGEGCRVIVDYHSQRGEAEKTADLARAAGGEALVLQGDVTQRDSMERLVAAAGERWGPVQILVNNAVAFEGQSAIETLSEEKLARMYDVVVKGAVNAAAACAPGMKEAGWGRIVNITSRSAIYGNARMSHYAAAKAALVGLTRTWAKELGPAGILVNAVAPTVIMTEAMLENMPDKVRERLAERNPLGRLATPEDIARVILYLGSAWNSYVNGEVITVGGGDMS